MFKAVKDIMKIIWNGTRDIRNNVNAYCMNHALITYDHLKASIDGKEWSEEELEKTLWSCGFGLQCVEKHILAFSALFVTVYFGLLRFEKTYHNYMIYLVLAFLVYLVGLGRLFRKRYALAAKRQLLIGKLAKLEKQECSIK